MRFEVYPDVSGQWRWRLWSANNRIIATSGEGYINKSDCLSAIALVKQAHNAPVIESQ